MARSDDAMDLLWSEMNREVASRKFLVFPGSISLEAPTAIWPTEQAIGGFLDLAASLGVRMVYLRADELAPAHVIDAIAVSLAEVDDAIDAETPEEFFELVGIAQEPAARDLLGYARKHYGRRETVRAEWVHEGIVHRYSAYADWHAALFDKAGKVAEMLDVPREDGE